METYNKYETVVGLEIHLELNTKTKMFSSSGYSFKSDPNTNVNEIDLGHPGTLPSVNKEAVKKAMKICLALNLEIDPLLKFDRKNYYYSDLPKGFQITQQFYPIGKDGHIYIELEDENNKTYKKKIRIERAHLEEDTAKQSHLSDLTLIDYNRAGVPLVEIVTKPDMRNGEEAMQYVERIRQTMIYLDVSDCKMEEGSLRCDVNVSVKEKDSEKLGNKVEIKNLNSINSIKESIDFETKRQIDLIEKGEEIVQETRRFDDKTKTTISMRKKEDAVDYKYFPEANIRPIRIKDEEIEILRQNMPELPEEKFEKYLNKYKVNLRDTRILTSNFKYLEFFEKVLEYTEKAQEVSNLFLSEFLGIMTKREEEIEDIKVKAKDFAKLVEYISEDKISSKQGKIVLEEMFEGKNPDEVIKEKNMVLVSNENEILKIVKEVMEENTQSIEDFKSGKDRAFGYLVGQIMKASKGKANPKVVSKLLKEEIDKV